MSDERGKGHQPEKGPGNPPDAGSAFDEDEVVGPLTNDDFFCLQCIKFGDEDRDRSHDCPEHLRRDDVAAAVKWLKERLADSNRIVLEDGRTVEEWIDEAFGAVLNDHDNQDEEVGCGE